MHHLYSEVLSLTWAANCKKAHKGSQPECGKDQIIREKMDRHFFIYLFGNFLNIFIKVKSQHKIRKNPD